MRSLRRSRVRKEVLAVAIYFLLSTVSAPRSSSGFNKSVPVILQQIAFSNVKPLPSLCERLLLLLLKRETMNPIPLATRAEIVGALPPPPGVRPNFEHPESDGYRLVVVTVIFLLLASFVLSLRIYTRRIIVHAIGYDDCKYPQISKDSVFS